MKRREPQNQVALFPAKIETVNNAFSDIRKRILEEEKAPVKACASGNKVAEALQAKIAIKAERKAKREAAQMAPEAPKPAQVVVAPKAEEKRKRAPGAGRKTLDNAETLRRPVSIPAAMWHNIQVCGKAQSMSASEVIRRAVAQYLGGEVNDISENQG